MVDNSEPVLPSDDLSSHIEVREKGGFSNLDRLWPRLRGTLKPDFQGT
jgi:hypothetical protein